MSEPLVHFGVRLRSAELLTTMAERVGGALGLPLALVIPDDVPDAPRYECRVIGLHIVLSYWPWLPDGQWRTYRLSATPVGAGPFDFARVIDLSEFVADALKKTDSPDWYVPTKEERLRDGGIGG